MKYSNRFYSRRRAPPKTQAAETNQYTHVKVFFPNDTFKIIEEISKLQKKPLSRIVGYAVFNEMEKGADAFKFKTDYDPDMSVENDFIHEAGQIYNFLKTFPTGKSLDELILFKRTLQIPDIIRLVGGYKTLLDSGFIEEVFPFNKQFEYAHDYRVARIKPQVEAVDFEKRRGKR